ncbi:hypothetical protein N7481_013438 [Penicillium waksmanii]|uniref:uncharacterized protein n=1 Tax=Penicillium waksmanii TaxID=69791 RepID=UPI0025497931|nr:uncharacterized protein N7481_013438 [Penicillium waksmanii]KAJ5963133.1 hypothetical protein N7481_013438 [Penicillium waksmanii]
MHRRYRQEKRERKEDRGKTRREAAAGLGPAWPSESLAEPGLPARFLSARLSMGPCMSTVELRSAAVALRLHLPPV